MCKGPEVGESTDILKACMTEVKRFRVRGGGALEAGERRGLVRLELRLILGAADRC